MNIYELQMKLKDIMLKKELQIEELKECADSAVRKSYFSWAEMMLKAHHKELLQAMINYNMKNRREYGSNNREN